MKVQFFGMNEGRERWFGGRERFAASGGGEAAGIADTNGALAGAGLSAALAVEATVVLAAASGKVEAGCSMPVT